ncbi:hypothetical protein [Microcoleus sp. herbarium2]|uniref:hypothetical protein n=1 Tax=Microcoleus sp. herbarium2 TaxID=3055433 RepID=UPI002FD2E429
MQYLSINGKLASFAIINYEENLNKLVEFMVQTIQARNVTMYDLETKFKIE